MLEGLEVHVVPAPERVAGPNWAFAGALPAKALEHIAYAMRLTPASKAWDSVVRESKQISAVAMQDYVISTYVIMDGRIRKENEN
ncbi:hypothetical protein Q9L58_010255 [Maublancomyces gigas]|uniref:Uncharacterized protein n=1 Tax=Discina gigas TaxID=1032678 RepID=A0ABR3G4L3_9PEZI